MKEIVFVADGGKELSSFAIRGRQLAASMGARAVFRPTPSLIDGADIIVAVKRASPELVAMIRKSGKPWVWDILDCWGQPSQSLMARDQAVAWLRGRAEEMAPSGLVCTTTAMLTDLCPSVPAIVLPHHGWDRPANPIRAEACVVGYEGNPRYIDGWHRAVARECAGRGMSFFINPADFGVIDILLAVRDKQWDGYPSRAWKSNVKVANAQITGTPVIALGEAGSLEFASGAETWIETPEDLGAAIDQLTPHTERSWRSKMLLAGAIRVDDVASRYREWLEKLA